MKTRSKSGIPATKPQPPAGACASMAALDIIVKHAYRRHGRGRIAKAAIASCLGS